MLVLSPSPLFYSYTHQFLTLIFTSLCSIKLVAGILILIFDRVLGLGFEFVGWLLVGR